MLFYILYRIGAFLALTLPLRFTYGVASLLAHIHYNLSGSDRRAVKENIKTILGKDAEDKELENLVKDVFRNFAKYLVDFLRFSKFDLEYMKRFVRVEGLSNIDEAMKRGKGVIALSAHVGNWELGGYALGKLGYSISAVVLPHKEKDVNKFFIDQRALGNFKSIELGAGLRACYNVLKNNELLALLGDRNFSGKGVETEFFGKSALMPKGPAVLSVRTGAAVVCCYMIKQRDDTYRIDFEKPIYPEPAIGERAAVEKMMRQYLSSIESILRQYPDQWYVFKYFWGNNGKDERTDTVV